MDDTRFLGFILRSINSGIIYVALMRRNVLGDRLFNFQWLGVIWNVISVVLVGATAILNENSRLHDIDDAIPIRGQQEEGKSHALLGVLLVLLGAFIQAMQFVFEEKVMTMVRSLLRKDDAYV